MKATCPECGCNGHLATFFAEDDGKRLAMALATMPPELGRAALGYLSLWRPPKSALRLTRAIRIVDELNALVATGTVCKDERTGIRRPASPAVWAAGIEQMLTARAALSLPLESHGYLRSVVFSLTEKADTVREIQREADLRAGRHLTSAATSGITPSPNAETPLQRQLTWITHMVNMGQFTPEQAAAEREAARAKFAGSDTHDHPEHRTA